MQAMTGEQVASLLSGLVRDSLGCQSAEVGVVKEEWSTVSEINVIVTWPDEAKHGVRVPIYDDDIAGAFISAIDGHRSWRARKSIDEARKAA